MHTNRHGALVFPRGSRPLSIYELKELTKGVKEMKFGDYSYLSKLAEERLIDKDEQVSLKIIHAVLGVKTYYTTWVKRKFAGATFYKNDMVCIEDAKAVLEQYEEGNYSKDLKERARVLLSLIARYEVPFYEEEKVEESLCEGHTDCDTCPNGYPKCGIIECSDCPYNDATDCCQAYQDDLLKEQSHSEHCSEIFHCQECLSYDDCDDDRKFVTAEEPYDDGLNMCDDVCQACDNPCGEVKTFDIPKVGLKVQMKGNKRYIVIISKISPEDDDLNSTVISNAYADVKNAVDYWKELVVDFARGKEYEIVKNNVGHLTFKGRNSEYMESYNFTAEISNFYHTYDLKIENELIFSCRVIEVDEVN